MMPITTESEYSTLLLLSQGGPVLMVEGDDDILIFKHIITPNVKLIASSGGKSRVLNVAKMAEDQGLDRAHFLVDSDYDSYKPKSINYPSNVTSSEHHDCFIDLIADDLAPLRETIHSKLLRAKKRPNGSCTTNTDAAAKQVLADAIRIASALAAVRIVSVHFSLKLKIQTYNIFQLTPETITAHHAYKHLCPNNTVPPEIERQHFQMIKDTLDDFTSSSFPRVGDHDLLKAVIKILNSRPVHIQANEEELRCATLSQISPAKFRKVRWLQELLRWCEGLGFDLYTERSAITYQQLTTKTT